MNDLDLALARLREGTEVLRTGGGGTTLTAAQCNLLLNQLADLESLRHKTEQERDLANACIDALEVAMCGSLKGRSRDTLEHIASQLVASLEVREEPWEQSAALALLEECLNDEEPWEPERLVERMEAVFSALGGAKHE